jgi:ABC-type glycerol-3-phosphate transport system substrate-binding protein
MQTFDDLSIHRYVREISSTYGGVTIGVPISGKPLSLSYRRDIFVAANLSVPNTW